MVCNHPRLSSSSLPNTIPRRTQTKTDMTSSPRWWSTLRRHSLCMPLVPTCRANHQIYRRCIKDSLLQQQGLPTVHIGRPHNRHMLFVRPGPGRFQLCNLCTTNRFGIFLSDIPHICLAWLPRKNPECYQRCMFHIRNMPRRHLLLNNSWTDTLGILRPS